MDVITECCCGNTRTEQKGPPGEPVKVKALICHCGPKQGPGPSHGNARTDMTRMGELQYNERKAHGLPLKTDLERSVENRWS